MRQPREYSRFLTNLPVIFCWKDKGRSHASQGMVRDISTSGAYILTSQCPSEKTAVRCRMRLPSLRSDASPMAFTVVEMVGRILRREKAGARIGFAVRSRAIALRDEVLDREASDGIHVMQ